MDLSIAQQRVALKTCERLTELGYNVGCALNDVLRSTVTCRIV
jgi:hypothetical protein